MFKTLKRLISLEEYLGVRFSPKEKGCAYDTDEHMETEWGAIKKLRERVEKLEKLSEKK